MKIDIKLLRQSLGASQRYLGYALGIRPDQVSEIEKATNPPMIYMKRIMALKIEEIAGASCAKVNKWENRK